jgi:hypothetical protein
MGVDAQSSWRLYRADKHSFLGWPPESIPQGAPILGHGSYWGNSDFPLPLKGTAGSFPGR